MGNLTDLPPELGIRIAQRLSTPDAINLACTSRALLDIAETQTWRELEVTAKNPLPHPRPLAEFDQAWHEFGAAVAHRPTRRSLISLLHCHLTPQSTPLLFDLLAPPSTITYLDLSRMFLCVDADRSSLPGMQILARGPRSDGLTRFSIVDRTAREVDVYACLANMPNLVSLDLWLGKPKEDEDGQFQTSTDMKHGVSRDDIQAGHENKVRLPKLKRLSFQSHMWLDPLICILDHAPIVEHLSVTCDDPYEEPDVEKYRHKDELAVRVLRSSTIRLFDADDGIVQLIYGDAMVPLPPDWMPNMTRMSSWALPWPGHFPQHDRLEDLIFWDDDYRDITDLFGTLPSSTTTGVIAPWIVENLAGLPSLTRLELYIDERRSCELDPTDGESYSADGGFHFTVFSNDKGDNLCHARVTEVTEVEEILLTHHYRSDRPNDLAWNLAVHYDDDDETNPDGVTVLEAPNPDVDDMDGPLDLSSYGGRPLPKSLLLWVYQEGGVEWSWTQGTRGVALPEHVWQYLREWHDEVASAQL